MRLQNNLNLKSDVTRRKLNEWKWCSMSLSLTLHPLSFTFSIFCFYPNLNNHISAQDVRMVKTQITKTKCKT